MFLRTSLVALSELVDMRRGRGDVKASIQFFFTMSFSSSKTENRKQRDFSAKTMAFRTRATDFPLDVYLDLSVVSGKHSGIFQKGHRKGGKGAYPFDSSCRRYFRILLRQNSTDSEPFNFLKIDVSTSVFRMSKTDTVPWK